MAVLVLVVLILALTGYSDASWCVCKPGAGDGAQQKALDYACGAGGDCAPILQNGPCYQPNTVGAHCNWAVNSYYQKKGQAPGSCEFSGSATVTGTDPSVSGCTYPSSGSSTGTPTTPTTGGINPPTTLTPPTGTGTGAGTGTGFTPNTPTGIIGGGIGSLGPSGSGINTDNSDGGILFQRSTNSLLLLVTLWFSGLVFWWG